MVRLAALAAAAALALTSRGDAYVLAALLAIGIGPGVAALGVVLGLVAVSVRFGSSSLEAIAGAQAVLGPAGTTGPAPGAAAAWFAAAAIVTPALRPRVVQEATIEGTIRTTRWLASAALGLAAVVVVVGPGAGGAIAARVVASCVAVVLAAALGEVGVLAARDRRRPAAIRPVDLVPGALGLVAVVLAVVGR